MRRRSHRYLVLLALALAAACEEGGTGPDVELLAADELVELAVLEDEASFEAALEVAEMSVELADELGEGNPGEARTLITQARERLEEAREARRTGGRRNALAAAREARRLLARAILSARGTEALEALIERLEELAITAPGDEEVFDAPEEVAARLDDLAASARERLAAGDTVGAAERAVFGEQVARHHRGRRHHRGEVSEARARLAVALATTAVSLAERLIADDAVPARDTRPETDTHRNRWLSYAKRMLALAERALEGGHFARAVHFAQHASWSALKAVVLPGGITEEELAAMAELANDLLAQAEEAVGSEPTEIQARLLARAKRLIALGEEMIERGHVRGVAGLWRGAVISAWLIG